MFDEHSQPLRGHLQDGVTIDSNNNGRQMHGTSPTMDLAFAGQGVLRNVHLERGVQIVSDEETASVQGTAAFTPEMDFASGGYRIQKRRQEQG